MDGNARFMGIDLEPGVLRRHMFMFLAGTFFLSIAMTVMGATTPWLLSSVIHVPTAEQGQASGHLSFVQQLVGVIALPALGAMADRWGRRAMLASGIVVIAVSLVVQVMVDTLTGLLVARVIFSFGLCAAAAAWMAVLADYPVNASRGKAAGIKSMIFALGSMFTLMVLMRVPHWIIGADDPKTVDMVQVTRLWFALIVALVLVGAALAWGLRPGTVRASTGARPGIAASARASLELARRDGRVSLVLLVSCIVQGGSGLVGAFLLLWINQYAETSGMSPGEAAKAGGSVLTIGVLMQTVLAPVVGALGDRISRAKILSVAMLAIFASFAGMGLIDDPLGLGMKLAVVFLVGGQVVGGMMAQAILGDIVPAALRGSVAGFFMTCGAIGGLVFAAAGGPIFDTFGPAAPFVASSGLYLLMAVLTVWVVARPRLAPEVPQAAAAS